MRRSVLVTLVVLGSLISLIGSSGLFAALTDTARTGTNSVSSSGLAASADIQLATATGSVGGVVTCGTFSEDLSSGFFSISDIEADSVGFEQYFCIKNVGSQSVSLSAMTDELTDLDTACTGDEAEYDLTCGKTFSGNDQVGELSANLYVGYSTLDCSAASYLYSPKILATNATTAEALGDLAPGTTGCFYLVVYYPGGTAANAVQAAQSDTVTWRFKFIAEA